MISNTIIHNSTQVNPDTFDLGEGPAPEEPRQRADRGGGRRGDGGAKATPSLRSPSPTLPACHQSLSLPALRRPAHRRSVWRPTSLSICSGTSVSGIFASSTMATWLQRIIRTRASSFPPTEPKLRPPQSFSSSRFFSKSTNYVAKVGIPEFLTGIGNGVESHVAKLESELGDFQKLLVTRTLKLKKLGIPCKHRKLILKYTHKYRLGLWRPRAEPMKS
ncbi:hypothetical protein PIB30_053759 [Stylosanthes scabra]|uniref:Small ribosomal subunit protein mS41 SAM domain-containing protein n=1 Tax=Stylosanthes scabra TaxID=79078 RepID=A0ABU6TKP2_9FABA|nr:hypothetical protein [Stylosanthes scabra]